MKPAHLAALLVSAAAYALLAYAVPRPAFGLLAGLLALAFGLYVWLLKTGLPLRQGLLAALLLRLLWLPALPALSDDYHRFRWDGLLLSQGQNPYRHRPDELAGPDASRETHNEKRATKNEQLQALYPRLNSPHYYSVYPPVDQAVFGLAAGLFPASERGFVVALRGRF